MRELECKLGVVVGLVNEQNHQLEIQHQIIADMELSKRE